MIHSTVIEAGIYLTAFAFDLHPNVVMLCVTFVIYDNMVWKEVKIKQRKPNQLNKEGLGAQTV